MDEFPYTSDHAGPVISALCRGGGEVGPPVPQGVGLRDLTRASVDAESRQHGLLVMAVVGLIRRVIAGP